MLETTDKQKGFEDVFNTWYRQFIDEEKTFNEEIKKARLYRYLVVYNPKTILK